MVQLEDDAPCCDKIMNSPPATMGCSIPVGGLLGLAASLAGYWFYFLQGLEAFEDVVNDLGVDHADKITLVLNNGVIIIILANVFVTGYGLREKCRTRNDCLGHLVVCGFPSLIKFIVKTAVHLVVCGSVAVALLLMLVSEGLWVAFLTIDAVCGSDVVDSVTEVMELIGSSPDDITETCDSVAAGLSGTKEVVVGSMILVVSQIVILCYWYKYSTLAMVAPFYTTGKWAKGAPAKNPMNAKGKAVELIASAPSQSKAPAAEAAAEFKPKKAPRKL